MSAFRSPRARGRCVVLAVTASFALVVVACGGGSSSPDAGAAQSPMPRGALAEDAQVLEGRKVFAANCATCHGVSGGGGVGPSFNDGKLLRDFADAGAQEAFVKMGKGVMPSFSSLGSKRIAAVVRYEREVLSKQQ